MKLKKSVMMMLAGMSAVVLVACGETTTEEPDTVDAGAVEVSEEEKAEEVVEESEEEPVEEETSSSLPEPEEVDGLGIMSHDKLAEEDERVLTFGDMELTVGRAGIIDLERTESSWMLDEGIDDPKLIVVDMTAENKSENDVSFYPDQSTMVTSTGQQVDADLFMSEDVGGDFLGQVKKSGVVMWVVDGAEGDIESSTLIIGEPYLSDDIFTRLGEEQRIEFNFKPSEELWDEVAK